MLRVIKRILQLSPKHAKNIKLAFIFSFLESMFINIPLVVTLMILVRVLNKANEHILSLNYINKCALLIFIALVTQYLLRLLIYHFQSASGYKIFCEERIKLGNHFKRIAMGYYSNGNIGDISSIITSDLTFVEMYSMSNLDKVINSFAGILISVIFMFYLDYRVSLVAISITIPVIVILINLQKTGNRYSRKRQDTQGELVDAVLEYLQGMSVIKAFNLVGDRLSHTKSVFKRVRDKYIEFEKKIIYPNTLCDILFAIGIGLTILTSIYLYINKQISLPIILVLLIFIFKVYQPFQAIGVLTGFIRIMDACLDRYSEIENIKVIDKDGTDTKLNNFDIEFHNVSFAYDKTNVLNNLSFKVAEKSMTALVGHSGCGKTTITNLIARFWDIEHGEIKIGDVNIKTLTCDSLLKNISIVFQNVYLFNDTILNNIKFGKANASMSEVIEACKKARCHDFITQLEHGYHTVINEAGSNFSGGEKQRISIARAILKDAPIILLDEATANVDPYNEKYIQQAVDELVKNKTLIVIAHRLSTIKKSNQILVLEKGRIIEKGNHQQLMNNKGQYFDYWKKREQASGWKITKQ
ncbi:ABC transporter ATP-binding protein [Clostridium sp. 'deep sea']|uniref:ABC transporter ATP-binding protein n=1 Tax=Clostridium sp. 'deep sea' TaxID=2779445 RepID=UPI0018969773|nr:ABC transporter ATP-binding protein [Clostridium sp. 'deep sea']QOR34991.1 ABC transporter ATP-binding protein [Clostridium sp. 'deep sea']